MAKSPRFEAFAAPSAGAPLEPFSYEPGPLAADSVELEIECCGICHSDVHLVDDDWRTGRYPLVPGHEIVGRIADVGEAVRGLARGQRVGIGWQRSSCGRCAYCVRGDENLCASQEPTCVRHFGGFADRIRVDARFVFAIPDALDPERAAPLLCGGATVYAPLRRYVTSPGMRVGVVGIGGLGHLALQFAAALGAEVTAFSTRLDKEAEARSFGATALVATHDTSALRPLRRRFDVLLSTVHAKLDWPLYVRMLAPGGVLVLAAASDAPLDVPPALLLDGQRSTAGTAIAGRRDITEMLALAAQRGIGATVERYGFDRANEALDRTRRNEARYRAVLTRLG
jgi:alcohol/geraniol dehydrogenase (NADP+)